MSPSTDTNSSTSDPLRCHGSEHTPSGNFISGPATTREACSTGINRRAKEAASSFTAIHIYDQNVGKEAWPVRMRKRDAIRDTSQQRWIQKHAASAHSFTECSLFSQSVSSSRFFPCCHDYLPLSQSSKLPLVSYQSLFGSHPIQLSSS